MKKMDEAFEAFRKKPKNGGDYLGSVNSSIHWTVTEALAASSDPAKAA